MSKPVASFIAEENQDGYGDFETIIRERVAGLQNPLFTTDCGNLYEVFLSELPPDRRQHYNCHACRKFVNDFGGLVKISEGGLQMPMLWWLASVPFFDCAVEAAQSVVAASKVTGVFYSSDKTWGRPVTGDWTHLSGVPSLLPLPEERASQLTAEKREEYIMLRRGLEEFPIEAVAQAVRILEADALDRSEKTLGVAKWLFVLHQRLAGVKGKRRDNMIWLAVATAPPGFCHVRSTMISKLLDDIVAGLPFDQIKRRWADKMHPLQYQRPTALKEGAIAKAEKLVAELDSAGALARRFAKLEDLTPIWVPMVDEVQTPKPGAGVFDHLREGPTIKELEIPAQGITWDKFSGTVLPNASGIECYVPGGNQPFFAMVTAVNADAAPILQWDGLPGQPRNPVSCYMYYGGSPASRWGLSAGSWVKVNAITLSPWNWQEPEKFSHHTLGAFFILDGARDLTYERGGCFFPETLRSEYHEIRQVMEAHAQKTAIAGKEEGTANGLEFQKGGQAVLVRVKSKGVLAIYCIDRWD